MLRHKCVVINEIDLELSASVNKVEEAVSHRNVCNGLILLSLGESSVRGTSVLDLVQDHFTISEHGHPLIVHDCLFHSSKVVSLLHLLDHL